MYKEHINKFPGEIIALESHRLTVTKHENGHLSINCVPVDIFETLR